jgi:preprotein translocase subunit SecE
MRSIKKLIEFLAEVRAELKKVTWPTWIEVFSSTVVVIFTTLLFAALIGVWDKILMEIMLRIL